MQKIPKKLLTIRQSAGIIISVVRHGTNIWGISSAGRALAWHARGHRFDPGILHQKSTVLRRKYGAFLFTEAGFWGAALLRLHRFQAFAGGSYTTPKYFRKVLSSTLPMPSKGDLTGAQGRNVTSPINRLRGRVSRRRTDDRQKLLHRLSTISAYKKMR